MVLVYRLICAMLAALVIVLVLRSRDLREQATGGLVLVILLLRILGIK